MSYESENGLNDLDVAEPLDGATPAELLAAFRQLKAVVKNAMLVSHYPDGRLRPGAFTKLDENLVGTGQLVNLGVTAPKLGLASVISEKIADSAITAVKLATDSVTEDKYADGSIPAAAYKPNTIPLTALAGYVTKAYLSSHVSDNALRAVTDQAIADKAVVDRTIDTVTFSKLIGGSDNSLLFKASGVWQAVSLASGALAYNSVTNQFESTTGWKTCTVASVKSRGVGGGAGLTNDWTNRTLTEVSDTFGIFSGASGSGFKLLVGTYLVQITCPAHNVGKHQTKLVKLSAETSTVTTVTYGSSSKSSNNNTTISSISTILVVTSADDVYNLQHWVETGTNAYDLGFPATSSDTSSQEIYVQGQFIKIA